MPPVSHNPAPHAPGPFGPPPTAAPPYPGSQPQFADQYPPRPPRALGQLTIPHMDQPPEPRFEEHDTKTRILGFAGGGAPTDAIGSAARQHGPRFPAGWLVVVEGPGMGAFFAVTTSVSNIGRGMDQEICLDFGDTTISRQNHAAVAYDAEQNRFFLGHGHKSNVVRRNGQPVLATEELTGGDRIRIGKTTLLFVALCGAEFSWPAEALEGTDDDG